MQNEDPFADEGIRILIHFLKDMKNIEGGSPDPDALSIRIRNDEASGAGRGPAISNAKGNLLLLKTSPGEIERAKKV